MLRIVRSFTSRWKSVSWGGTRFASVPCRNIHFTPYYLNSVNNTDIKGEESKRPTKTFKSFSFHDSKNLGDIGDEENIGKEDVLSLNHGLNDYEMTRLVHGSTDSKIAITERASAKLRSIAKGDNNMNTALRIVVESGGCHGFQYNFKLTDLQKELEKEDEYNKLFVFRRAGSENDGTLVILDESSLQILQESMLDFTKELIGSQFRISDSPYTSTSCGCGASFDFDFEKLEKAKAAH